MAGESLKKSSVPGVSIRQVVEELPEGCSTPDFKQKPIPLALQEGRNAIFRAVVCGEPRPEVHWQRTKGDLSDPSKYKISSLPGSKEHVLQVNKLTGEDTDLYRCTAVNMYGEATCSVRLTVIEVGFRKSRKRHKEPPQDLRKELMDFRKMLKKRAPPAAPEEKMDPKQVWQLLMTANRKDYEQICRKYGIVDFRGMLRKLQAMQKEREDRMAQYVHTISNLRHIRVTKEGVAVFDLELELKDPGSRVYLYKDGEMIPFGFDNQAKHCLRRLGKRHHFQIQDLRPEDAGMYQVRVEDAEVFSTELEASAVPPRVVTPLAGAHCKQQADAVFECTLSSPCPGATWQFQHRLLRPSDRYEVSVSPDGLTHRLVVKGAQFSDMGLYSLGTGLHASSAWLLVEAGKEQSHLTASADRKLQVPGAQDPEAGDLGGVSREGGRPGEQGPMGVSPKGAGLHLTGLQERGGLGGPGHSMVECEGTSVSVWGPGQVREGFAEAKGGRAILSGEHQLYRQGDWGGCFPGALPPDEDGPKAGVGLQKGQQAGHSRGWGPGDLGGSWERGGHREDRQGQEHCWDPQRGAGAHRRALLGRGEGMEVSQEGGLDELAGKGRERGEAGALWGLRTGDNSGTRGAGSQGPPGEGGSGPRGGMGPKSWGSQGGRVSVQGRAGWPGPSLGQICGDQGIQEQSRPDGREFPGCRSPEAKVQGSLNPEVQVQESPHKADDRDPMAEGRGHETGSGGLRDWEGGSQELRGQGLGGQDVQETAGALPGTGEDSGIFQASHGLAAGQRVAGGTISMESETTGPWSDKWPGRRQPRVPPRPAVPGIHGGKVADAWASESLGSGQGVDGGGHRHPECPGLGAQGSGGMLGDTDGVRDLGAMWSESDYWKGSHDSRGQGPRGGMGYQDGLAGAGGTESSYGGSCVQSEGIHPENGADCSDSTGVPGELESDQGARGRVTCTPGAPGGIQPEEAGGARHSPRGTGRVWSGGHERWDLGRGGSGSVGRSQGGRGGSGRGSRGGVGHWGASPGQGQRCPGTVISVAGGDGGSCETVGTRHLGTDPGGSGRAGHWGQRGDGEVFRNAGAVGPFGERGYEDGTGEPGSQKVGGQEGDAGGTRGPGARVSDLGARGDNIRHPEAFTAHDGVGSESQWAHGPGCGPAYGAGTGVPGPLGTGGRPADGRGPSSPGLRGPAPGNKAAFRGGLRGMGSGGEGDFRGGSGGPRRVESGGEGDFRGGSGGLRGMGSGGEGDFRGGSGGLRGMGSGGEGDFRGGSGGPRRVELGGEGDFRGGSGGSRRVESGGEEDFRGGSGGPRRVESGGEGDFRGGSGGLRGMGSGGEGDFRGGSGGLRGMGSGGEGDFRGGSGGPRRVESGGEGDFRGGFVGLRGMGLGGKAGFRDGVRGSGKMGSGGELGYRTNSGIPNGMGSGGKEDHRAGLRDSGKMRSGGETSYKRMSGGPGEIPLGGEPDGSGGLGDAGVILSQGEAGHCGGFQGTQGPGLGGEGGHGVMGPGGEKGCGDRVMGPLAGLGWEGGHRGPATMGSRSGRGVLSDASPGSLSSKVGLQRGRGVGLVNRTGLGVALGVVGLLGTADGMAFRDRPRGPGQLSTPRGPEMPSDGPGSGHGLVGHGNTPAAWGINDSKEKSGVCGWQDGSGVPGPSRTQEAPGGEGRSAGRAGAVGPSGQEPGWDEDQAAAAAVDVDHGLDFGRAGPRVADRAGAADQRGWALQGAEDWVLGDSRRGAGWGSSAEPDQARDCISVLGGRANAILGDISGRGVSSACSPGWEDQDLGQDNTDAGNRPPDSGNSSSLHERHAMPRGTPGGPGGSKGREGAPGQEEPAEGQGPWAPDSKRDTCSGLEGSDVLSKGCSPEWGDGLTPESRQSRSWGSQSGTEGPCDRTGWADRPGTVQGRDFQLNQSQTGRSGVFREQGALEGESNKDIGPRTPIKYGDTRAESHERSSSLGGRSHTQPGVRSGVPKNKGTEEAQVPGQPRGGKNRGHPGKTPSEDWSQEPAGQLGSKPGGTVGSADVHGWENDATQRCRSGQEQLGTGSFSERTRGPTSHFSQGLTNTTVQQGEATMLSCTLTSDLGPGAWFKDDVKLTGQDGGIFQQEGLVHGLLPRMQVAQAGRHSFVAGNQRSEGAFSTQDGPTIAPNVAEQLREPLEVKAGRPVTVKVPFENRLPVQVSWRKDGVEVPDGGGGGPGAQVALGGGCTRLCLPSASRVDRDQYSMTPRSARGSVEAQLTLQVLDKSQPPQGLLKEQHGHRARVHLRWQAPRDDGGRAVQHYMVERRQAGRSTWLKVGEAPADSPTFTDAQVEQGQKYAFRVRAVTSEGPGQALQSEEVLVAPEALPRSPAAPALLSASSQGIPLTWAAPRGPGSAHVLGYLIEKRKKGSSSWAAANAQSMPERRWTVADLQQGCQYEFRVTAMAPSGSGEPGPPLDAVFARDPRRLPGPVRDLRVTDTSHTSIALSWEQPDPKSGDEAMGYVVELRGSDRPRWQACHMGTVADTTYTAKGLRSRESYFMRVAAMSDGVRGHPIALDTLIQARPVSDRPKFLTDSSTKDLLTVKAGDLVRVPVPFEAAPLPEVTWLKDGLPLPKRSVTITTDGLTQLLIPVASSADSGLYTVLLQHPQAKEATYNFHIRVAAHPRAPGPICLQENVPGTVTAEWGPSLDEDGSDGAPLHYTVFTRSSAHGSWREVADRVHTNRFTLLGVLPGHEYHFRVVAKNELGASPPSDTSQPWYIPRQQRDRFTVRAPSYREPALLQKPRFLVGLRTHLLPQGCECSMTCAVRGAPLPRVTWFKDGQSLEGDPAVHRADVLGVCSLVIPCVTLKDSGQYKAVAENTLGHAVSTATLIVTESSS